MNKNICSQMSDIYEPMAMAGILMVEKINDNNTYMICVLVPSIV